MPGRPPRILLVDDNALLRTLFAQALESCGYEVIGADCGEAALELIATCEPPELCIVDHVMPGMTGAALVRALRTAPDERLRSLPVIGTSGLAGAERELLAAGADEMLRKPVGEAQLVAAVARALAVGARAGRLARAGAVDHPRA